MSSLDVLHVDNHLLVVAKPAGTPVVPDASGDESLLERAREWVRREFRKPGGAWLGVVQRLDRPVSGVVLFARTSKAAGRLSREFRERSVEKLYWGVVVGRLPDAARAEGEIVQWLRKDARANRVTAVDERDQGARLARTAWRLLERGEAHSLLELRPLTGRPHQLRVAATGLGTPLAGDLKYGAPRALPDRSVALHARALELRHPTRGERVRFEAPPPAGEVWCFQVCARARRAGASEPG